jgi:hemerythrin-like domain-containing protein
MMTNMGCRRRFLAAGIAVSAVGIVVPCSRAEDDESKEKEVKAVEDLMREHGVLRRTLLVYTAAAARLRRGEGKVPANALMRAAQLFRTFGEDYHERILEEQHVFPALAGVKSVVRQLPDVLKVQHDRGRAINDYVTSVTRAGTISSGNARPLADALDGLVLMYRHHAAIEDTVVFPAWKAAVSAREYDELTDRFEELEHQMFGKDGFDDAVARIAAIEEMLGVADLAAFTAPAPPKPQL